MTGKRAYLLSRIIILTIVFPLIFLLFITIKSCKYSGLDEKRRNKAFRDFSLVRYNLYKYRDKKGRFPDNLKALSESGLIKGEVLNEILSQKYQKTEYLNLKEYDDFDLKFRVKTEYVNSETIFEIRLKKYYEFLYSKLKDEKNVLFFTIEDRSKRRNEGLIEVVIFNKEGDKERKGMMTEELEKIKKEFEEKFERQISIKVCIIE